MEYCYGLQGNARHVLAAFLQEGGSALTLLNEKGLAAEEG